MGNIRLEAHTGDDNGVEQLQKVNGIKEVTAETTANEDSFRTFDLRVEAGIDPRTELYRLAVDRRWTLRELARRRATLEDVFVEITHAE